MDVEKIARDAMGSINPLWSDQYAQVAKFVTEFPEVGRNFTDKFAPTKGSKEYLKALAELYANGRNPTVPKPPETIPDEMVSIILNEYFDIDSEKLDDIKREHSLSMAAENMVGDLLERYIASVLEPHGWVWCAGSAIKAVDFIKAPSKPGGKWQLLQVKNRDNSENSSSSAIREGTEIGKWFRCFSKKAKTNWDTFPDAVLKVHLSESNFKSFVTEYLKNLKGGDL
jgi:hypothetical protein